MPGLWSSLGAVISEVLRCKSYTTSIILWSCQHVLIPWLSTLLTDCPIDPTNRCSSLWSSMTVNIHWRWNSWRCNSLTVKLPDGEHPLAVNHPDGVPYWRPTLLCTLLTEFSQQRSSFYCLSQRWPTFAYVGYLLFLYDINLVKDVADRSYRCSHVYCIADTDTDIIGSRLLWWVIFERPESVGLYVASAKTHLSTDSKFLCLTEYENRILLMYSVVASK